MNKCNYGGYLVECLCQNCDWDCDYCCEGIDEEGNCICDECLVK